MEAVAYKMINNPNNYRFTNTDSIFSNLKQAQTLASVSIIASPVSLVFGGTILSLCTLVCGIISRNKISKSINAINLSEKELKEDGSYATLVQLAKNLSTQAVVGIVLSCIALVINLITSLMVAIPLFNAIQSGDADQIQSIIDGSNQNNLLDSFGDNSDSSSDVSIWDK